MEVQESPCINLSTTQTRPIRLRGAVQRFLAFSRLLGVEYDGDPKTDEVKLSTLGRFFSSDDDAKLR